jgi:hypothetical protein
LGQGALDDNIEGVARLQACRPFLGTLHETQLAETGRFFCRREIPLHQQNKITHLGVVALIIF